MKIFFLGWGAKYERHFISYLSQHYNVGHIPSPKWLRRLHRFTNRIMPGRAHAPDLFVGTYCRVKGFDSADLLVCNDNTIKSKINPEIIKSFPGKKVMLIRNLIDAPFLEKWGADFDAIYSFDPEQCAQFGIGYLDQFIPIGYKQLTANAALKKSAKTGTIAFFAGLEKGRGATLLDLAIVLKDCDCKIDFRILADNTTQEQTPYHIASEIDYHELQEATRQADVLVEINQAGQSGFTLRALEAACYGKKLITSNPSVKESPLYHPNNVLILSGRETWTADVFREFLCLPLRPVEPEMIYRYSPDFMLESLIASHGVAP